MDNKKIIGQRINAALAASNKKQKDLANHLNVTDNTISYFCKGKRIPNTLQIIEIAKYLNVSADYLLGLVKDSSTDDNVKLVSKYTGLTKNSIDNITSYDTKYTEAVDHFLSSSFFVDIVERMIKCHKINNMSLSDFLDFLSYVPYEDTTLGDYETLEYTINKALKNNICLLEYDLSKIFDRYIETLTVSVGQNEITYFQELFTPDVDYCLLSDLVNNPKNNYTDSKYDYERSYIKNKHEKLVDNKKKYESILKEIQLVCTKFKQYFDTNEYEKRICELEHLISEINKQLNEEANEDAQHNPKEE